MITIRGKPAQRKEPRYKADWWGRIWAVTSIANAALWIVYVLVGVLR